MKVANVTRFSPFRRSWLVDRVLVQMLWWCVDRKKINLVGRKIDITHTHTSWNMEFVYFWVPNFSLSFLVSRISISSTLFLTPTILLGTNIAYIFLQWYDIVRFRYKPSCLWFWFHPKGLILFEIIALAYISYVFTLFNQCGTLVVLLCCSMVSHIWFALEF